MNRDESRCKIYSLTDTDRNKDKRIMIIGIPWRSLYLFLNLVLYALAALEKTMRQNDILSLVDLILRYGENRTTE